MSKRKKKDFESEVTDNSMEIMSSKQNQTNAHVNIQTLTAYTKHAEVEGRWGPKTERK